MAHALSPTKICLWIIKSHAHSTASGKNKCSWRGPARSSHAQFVQTRATRHHVVWPTSAAERMHKTTTRNITQRAMNLLLSTLKNAANLRRRTGFLPPHIQRSWYHVPTPEHGDIPNWTYRFAARPSTPISLRGASYRINDFTTESSQNLF